MDMTTMGCPCCGEDMRADQVTCWECYRESNRLTPGTYRTDGQTWTLPQESIDRYAAMRDARLACANA